MRWMVEKNCFVDPDERRYVSWNAFLGWQMSTQNVFAGKLAGVEINEPRSQRAKEPFASKF